MNKATNMIRYAVLFALVCAAAAGNAQVLYGTLTGNVTDPSGALVPGAKVELLNMGTNQLRETATDNRGAYLFNNVLLGTYKVTVKAPSFQAVAETNIEVSVSEVRRVDFKLEIAKTTTTVEVTAAAVELQTDKGDVRREIQSQEVTELPYNGGQGRNFQSLLYLLPGAGVPASREANSDAGNPARAQTVFMNGQSSQGNNTRFDGATIIYPWLPVNLAYVPPSDAIDVVNIVTNSMDAEQGAAGGAAINVSMKSGTNQLHGSAYEYNQSNIETALNPFNHGVVPKNVFNQYGVSVGGPIDIPKLVHGKDKLFFFFDWQGTKRNQFAVTPNLTLPSDAMRKGDFSAMPCPAQSSITAATTNDYCIYDPLTGNPDGTGRTPFPSNTIPTARIASAPATLAGLLPGLTRQPTGTAASYTQNYDAYGAYTFHRNNYDVKINYNPTQKLNVWGRYSALPMDIYAPLVLGPIAGGDAFNGGNPGHGGGKVQTTAIGFTYTISNTMLLDGNVGYTRQHIGADGDEFNADYGTDVLKIPGTNGVGVNYQGVPGFQVSGVANMGNTNTGSPFEFRDNQYTTSYNLTKVHGAHNLKFGFQYDHYALNHFQPQGGTFGTARGTFGFDGSITALCLGVNASDACNSSPSYNQSGVPFNSWAQFLLGYPSRMGKITQFVNPIALRFSDYGFYARDQWQVTSRLTVSYGLRWEYYPIFSHDHYGAVFFDPATKNILVGCEGGVPCDAGGDATKKDFAPRFGIAYRLTQKTVVRAGYGISIDPDNFRNQRNAYPAVVNQDYSPSSTFRFITNAGNAAVTTLATGLPLPTFPVISGGTIAPVCVPTTANPSCSGVQGTPTTYGPSQGTQTFQANQDRGYIQAWNLVVQHEFSPTMVAEIGYVGQHALRMMMSANINGSAPNTGNAGRYFYPYYQGDLNSYYPFGGTKYESLQVQLKKRFGQSLITVAYTYAHAMDNINGDNGDGTLYRTWPVSTALDWQASGFDRRQTLTASFVYQLPFGNGQKWVSHGPVAQVIGGWQLSSTISRFTGLPFPVGASNSVNAGGQTQSANQISSNVAIYGFSVAGAPYFDGTAFANPATGTLGSTGRNILYGPGFVDVDARLSRSFDLWKEGRVKFELLGEAFNSFNHPNYANPNATVGGANYGLITALCGSCGTRQLQVGGHLTF